MRIPRLLNASILVAVVGLLAAACTQPGSPQPAATSTQAPAVAAPAASTGAFGAPITSTQQVSMADFAKEPQRFQGQTLVMTGTVTSVCKNMGCWMVLEDAGHKARVRMHAHAFAVPRDCVGKKARVQGTATVTASAAPAAAHDCQHKHDHGGGEHHECPKAQVGEIAFDATGVEIL